ncbi:MAG TPA: hypothetical protein VN638_03115 [Nitrospiraceae bacterium]|nr:hypothetical protein [Nitrospiraceae bacterium]
MKETTTSTVDREMESSSDSVANDGETIFHTIEDGLDAMGHGVRKLFHDLPGHGVIVGGAVGLGAAMAVGVGELAVAAFTAYVSYRYFAYGEPLAMAIENAIKFEAGRLEEKEITKPLSEDV